MSSMLKADAVRLLRYGTKVDRATQVVPQTGSTTLFTVSTGRVIVTGITGIITTAGSATDPVLKLQTVPTVGSVTDMCAVVASFTSSALGGILSLDGNPATAMTYSTGVGQLIDDGGVVVPAGTIRVNTGASNSTLAIQWTLFYTSLDQGSAVVAS